MTFNSWEFLIFYPIVALLYFVLPKKFKWPMLLVASYYFYIFYQARLVFLILATTLISWLASNVIERTENKRIKKLMLAVTLVVCLGVLFFYKYFNFLSGSITGLISLFGGEPSPVVLNLILPVGISFYTFQTLSYVIDVYRGEVKIERNFFFYALFVSFFPQLVAGPIERPGNLVPQLKEPKKWNNEDAIKGAKHMLVGFFKKVCVADLLSLYVNAVYNNVSEASALGVIIATAMFAVQIYCDFSGYTDIAIGCSRIMGIRLMKNFDHPYTATTIKEFWSRWHISLSTWFKDYLYFPLGGSRCSKPRHMMNLFIVFMVSGLWHGAAWTYVIWGAIHGIYQIVGNLTIKKRNALIERIGLSPKSTVVTVLRRIGVFVLVCFSWLFFRANSMADAISLLRTLFITGWGTGLKDTLTAMNLNWVNLLMSVLSVLTLIMIDHMLKYEDGPDGSVHLTKNSAFIYYVWIVIFAWAILLSHDMTSTFIYFQF
ncbi:MAG: MBOAT family protein [Ruminococcaceae bacterium]|nr:MBOAT family protein [Oscillospiraceae bacterium]